jgi:hypothetical protein
LVDLATITGIVNAEIATNAQIADTKLAQISTAGVVSGAALTALTSVPGGAGVIPAANLTSVAQKGANSDITSLSGLTTPLSIAQGGTGAATAANARTALGLGTAAVLDVGTTANKVVQLDGSAKLPAVDGSQLTGITVGVNTANSVVYNGVGFANWTDLDLSATVGAKKTFVMLLLYSSSSSDVGARTNGGSTNVPVYTSNTTYVYVTTMTDSSGVIEVIGAAGNTFLITLLGYIN